jgi:TonB family protein
MDFRKNQAFWTAVILHLVVVFGLLLGVIIEAFKPKEQLHVFQMIDPPSDSPINEYTPPVETAQPDLPELELPDIPDIAPLPEPPPPPEVVKPTPKPTSTPTLVNADEFFEKNPRREVRPRPIPQVKPVPRVQIQTQKFTVPDIFIPSPSTRDMSPQEQDAMRRYVGQISAMLNRAWVKPGSLVGRDLRVTAIFYVDSSGRISNIRFQPGSGNAAFDTSVRAAFSKIRSAGPTPSGKGQEIRISFTMLD